ncbi:uncharacterized protein F4822DRAFT_415231 [Hypoxylon trugodes]|uniref:uncharacterized protein n=1 Tax=Hypoxylon trugodes TaxID=326681 RepID=UPI00219AD499|nr:uncharacterized protein F4822DRAFT_415231 [Hypoxylon trugodes]KAI1384458.1 hypothetical protein F4822DRAFT_415231 [Hypoxylon trugodes]
MRHQVDVIVRSASKTYPRSMSRSQKGAFLTKVHVNSRQLDSFFTARHTTGSGNPSGILLALSNFQLVLIIIIIIIIPTYYYQKINVESYFWIATEHNIRGVVILMYLCIWKER